MLDQFKEFGPSDTFSMVDDTRAHARRIQREIVAGCSPTQRVGVEVESFCVMRDGSRAPYAGPVSISDLLQRLGESLESDGLAAEPVCDSGSLVGLETPIGDVSLEPGCQLEWASPPCDSIGELGSSMTLWARVRDAALRDAGLKLVPIALDLRGDCSRSWPAKQRYDSMRRRYGPIGDQAWIPMQRTCGIHLSFDYSSQTDWAMKFRAVLAAMPVAALMFGNSPATIDGNPCASVRPLLWHAFDEERTRLPKEAFIPGFNPRTYAEWVARVSRLTPDIEQMGSREDDASTHMGEIFTPVRGKRLIEVRVHDRVSDDMVPVLAAFWIGLLYDPRSLRELVTMSSWFSSREAWEHVFFQACKDGRSPRGWLKAYARKVVSLSLWGLRRSGWLESRGGTAEDLLAEQAIRLGTKQAG